MWAININDPESWEEIYYPEDNEDDEYGNNCFASYDFSDYDDDIDIDSLVKKSDKVNKLLQKVEDIKDIEDKEMFYNCLEYNEAMLQGRIPLYRAIGDM